MGFAMGIFRVAFPTYIIAEFGKVWVGWFFYKILEV